MSLSITRRSWIFVALWAVGIVLLLWAGTRVDGYQLHVRGIPLPHPYPWAGVLTVCAAMSIEMLIFYGLIRPESYQRSWGRALCATAGGTSLVLFFGLGLMHSPPYVFSHWLWLAISTLAFLLLSAMSAVGAARSHAV